MLQTFLYCYFKDRTAATAIEYGLIAAGISLAIVTVVFAFGDELQALFTPMEDALVNVDAAIETTATSN